MSEEQEDPVEVLQNKLSKLKQKISDLEMQHGWTGSSLSSLKEADCKIWDRILLESEQLKHLKEQVDAIRESVLDLLRDQQYTRNGRSIIRGSKPKEFM